MTYRGPIKVGMKFRNHPQAREWYVIYADDGEVKLSSRGDEKVLRPGSLRAYYALCGGDRDAFLRQEWEKRGWKLR